MVLIETCEVFYNKSAVHYAGVLHSEHTSNDILIYFLWIRSMLMF